MDIKESNKPTRNEKSAESKRIDKDVEKSNKNSKVYLEEAERNILNSDSTKTNPKKSNHRHEEKKNKGNFLYNIPYGNLPVMEFKLPDGTSGTVDKVPRR